MVFTDKYRPYLFGGLKLVALVVLLIVLGEIILPFIFALLLAYLVNPTVLRIQRKIPNRNFAITSLLAVFFSFIFALFFLFGDHLIKDSKRFVNAVEVFTVKNESEINAIKHKVEKLVAGISANETFSESTKTAEDEPVVNEKPDLTSSIKSVYSFFSSDNGTTITQTRQKNKVMMFLYTLIYTIMMLYTYPYFEGKYHKYFNPKLPINGTIKGILEDFEAIFINYFRQRIKVVLICMFIFTLTFYILNLPGAIILGLLTGLLTLAAHFHYFTLPITAIGCWVLSVENDTNFWLYFGVLLLVFILVSILEELVFFTRIMKSVNGMNAAIMIFSFALWIYLLGGFIGTIIALPLTQLVMIYADRLLLSGKKT